MFRIIMMSERIVRLLLLVVYTNNLTLEVDRKQIYIILSGVRFTYLLSDL